MGPRIKPADIKKPIATKGSTYTEEPVDTEERANREELVDVKRLIVIYYKHQY